MNRIYIPDCKTAEINSHLRTVFNPRKTFKKSDGNFYSSCNILYYIQKKSKTDIIKHGPAFQCIYVLGVF